MKTEDSVGVVFVNHVAARGVFNNVINISFGTYNFTPMEDGKVEPDPAITCRLRMDKMCAIQLRDNLNDLLALIEKSEAVTIDLPETEGVIKETAH